MFYKKKITASQCELKPQSSHLNAEELMSPKQKNQSTSPNLPITENTINDDEVSVYYSYQHPTFHKVSVRSTGICDTDVECSTDNRGGCKC